MSTGLFVSGAASGIDWRSIVDQLMEIERRGIQVLEQRKSELNGLKSVWSEVKTRLLKLEEELVDLKRESTFKPLAACSSDEKILTATATMSASPGTYSITISRLAQAHTVASDRQADPSVALDLSGSFTINGQSITVSATDSLQSIRDKINSTPNTGVTASIVDNRLVIQSINTGASEAITFSDPDNVLETLGVLTSTKTVKNELVAPQDAEFTVNGLTVTRSVNDPGDVIAGVTLNLRSQASTPVTLEIKTDTQKVISSIKEFVDAYNGTLDYLNARLSKGGELFGDPTSQRLASSLRIQATDAVTGISSEFKCLAEIGIKTSVDKSGKLSVDESELGQAIESNPDAVWRLFADPDEGVAGVAERLNVLTEMWTRYGSGIIPNRLESFDMRIKAFDDQISREELRLELRERNLVQRFIAMENVLSSIQSESTWLQTQFTRLFGGTGTR